MRKYTTPEVPQAETNCDPVFTAIGKGDKWEGSCACGWWTRGTKMECIARARAGHRMKPDETVR